MGKRDSNWYIPGDWRLLGIMTVAPVFVGVFATVFLSFDARLNTVDERTLYGLGLAMGAASTTMLFAARLPLYKQGRFWTIGPGQLDRRHRRLYWLAHGFVAASVIFFGIVWLRVHGS